MSTASASVDLPDDPTDLDIQRRAIEVLESQRANREFLEYKVSGEGRIKDDDRFERRRKGIHTANDTARVELEYLKFIAELQHAERLERLEAELGIDA